MPSTDFLQNKTSTSATPKNKHGVLWFANYPKRHPIEFVAIFSSGFFLSGILLLSAGYVVPRQSVEEVSTSGDTAEEGVFDENLAFQLDLCIIVGLSLVCASAVTLVVVLIVCTCRLGRKDYMELISSQRYINSDVSTTTTVHAVQPLVKDLYFENASEVVTYNSSD